MLCAVFLLIFKKGEVNLFTNYENEIKECFTYNKLTLLLNCKKTAVFLCYCATEVCKFRTELEQ